MVADADVGMMAEQEIAASISARSPDAKQTKPFAATGGGGGGPAVPSGAPPERGGRRRSMPKIEQCDDDIDMNNMDVETLLAVSSQSQSGTGSP